MRRASLGFTRVSEGPMAQERLRTPALDEVYCGTSVLETSQSHISYDDQNSS